jgi:multidrug efflux pump subunit AcrB
MDLSTQLPQLLGLAWLMPLASFVLILFFGPKMGHHGRNAAWVATAAIVTSLVLSLVAFVSWLGAHPVSAVHHGGDHGAAHAGDHATDHAGSVEHAGGEEGHAAAGHGPIAYSGDWYTL